MILTPIGFQGRNGMSPPARGAAQNQPLPQFSGKPERSFYSARPNPLVRKFMQWSNVHGLILQGRSVRISKADLARLKALPKNAGILLVANHTGNLDMDAMLELSRRWGRSFVTMTSHQVLANAKPSERWTLRRLGAFSVSKGEASKEGRLYARQMLRAGKHPVLIFPEGEESYRSEGLLPFRHGAAKEAIGAARGNDRPVYVVPLTIQYDYGSKLPSILASVMGSLESAVGASSGKGVPEAERFQALMGSALDFMEQDYQTEATAEVPLKERLLAFQENLLKKLEAKYGMRNRFSDADLRIQRIENLIRKHGADAKDLEAVRVLKRLRLFPENTLEPAPSLSTVASGVSHLELLLLNHWPPSAMTGVRSMTVSVQEPIRINAYQFEHLREPHLGVEKLTSWIREAVAAGLGLESSED